MRPRSISSFAHDATLIGLGMLETMPSTTDWNSARFAHVFARGPEGVARFFLDTAAYGATVAPAPQP